MMMNRLNNLDVDDDNNGASIENDNDAGDGGHISNCDSEPPAHRPDADFVMRNGSSKIEAPTSHNLNSLAQRGDTNNNDGRPSELDVKLPATTVANGAVQQPYTRGRQPYRNATADLPSSDGFVPLRFVHVPNNENGAAVIDATKRAPSVPDLPVLSDETLRDKETGGRREQFEERLRRAHLRLNSDAESSVTRYRSKSTPSRGMWAKRSQSESGKAKNTEVLERLASHRGSHHWCINYGDANLLHTDSRQLEADTNGFNTLSSIEQHDENGFGSLPQPPAVIVSAGATSPGQDSSENNIAADVGTPNSVIGNASVKSSDGSDHVRNLSSCGVSSEVEAILEPPPPPPPATEKERLVERERQARHETERARRRHLALLRERRLDESGDLVENEGSDHVGPLGQVSFDEGLQPAPEFVGENALALDLPVGSSSVASSISMPRPPLPPPPATERERLVERERQARLETERARRRHLAVQREQQLQEEEENGSNSESLDTPVDGVVTTLPRTPEENNEESGIASPSPEVQNTDTEAHNLSYPMERFLERADDEEGPSAVPIDSSAAEATLPYTMELFLAENAVAAPSGDSMTEVERNLEPIGGDDIDVLQADNDPLVVTPAVQPTEVDADTNLDEIIPAAPIEASGGGANDLASSSGSATSNIEIGSLDENENSANTLTDNDVPSTSSVDDIGAENSVAGNVDPSTSRVSISPSHESFNSNDHPPRLTEADIAQLAEVEHASIGNAAPQSDRYEPSEPSVVGRGALDRAFSVATQTTVIESVTDPPSLDRGASAFGGINESEGSWNVTRVDSVGSIQTTSSGTSGGASSASIEAMPSGNSSAVSDYNENDHPTSEGLSSHSLSRSTSSDEILQMHQLTEADIVTMREIDYASVGNAPPHSVRDERLSESSIVAERSGRRPTTTITEIGSIDEESLSHDKPENASVEAMPSDHSMPSECGDNDSDAMIVYQASDMGSSASIEALPSIDGLDNYGSIAENPIPDAEEFTAAGTDNYDIESAPLLRNSHPVDRCDSRDKEATPKGKKSISLSLFIAINSCLT